MNFFISIFCKKYDLSPKSIIFLDGNFPETFHKFKKDYVKQSGIYGWVYKKSIKTYVGSALDIAVRPFSHLFKSTRTNIHLKNALEKHGLNSFVLVIFEHIGNKNKISAKILQDRENFYLTRISNKYNFLEKAYTSKGYKHTPESLLKIRKSRLGKVLSEETKEKLRQRFSGELNPFFGRKHSTEIKENLSKNRQKHLNPIFGKPKSKEFLYHATKLKTGKHNFISKSVKITNIHTNEVMIFESQKEAGIFFGYKTKYPIVKAFKNNFLFKNTWIVEIF